MNGYIRNINKKIIGLIYAAIKYTFKIIIVNQIDNEDIGRGDDIKAGSTRREFIAQVTLAGMSVGIAPWFDPQHGHVTADKIPGTGFTSGLVDVTMIVNGEKKSLQVDPRMTLLDMLREKLALMGSKKGCDRGQCGACTVLVNGRRINSCLQLTAICNGATITSVEGLSKGDELHPVQSAFIRHDAFQCGYCTPGQICSAVGLINEGKAKTDADIREMMSGNICRCGAYQHIFEAISEVYHTT